MNTKTSIGSIKDLNVREQNDIADRIKGSVIEDIKITETSFKDVIVPILAALINDPDDKSAMRALIAQTIHPMVGIIITDDNDHDKVLFKMQPFFARPQESNLDNRTINSLGSNLWGMYSENSMNAQGVIVDVFQDSVGTTKPNTEYSDLGDILRHYGLISNNTAPKSKEVPAEQTTVANTAGDGLEVEGYDEL